MIKPEEAKESISDRVEVRLPGGRFFVTQEGGIGIEHAGFVVVKPSLAHWIAAATLEPSGD
jgi:hypothetical protein